MAFILKENYTFTWQVAVFAPADDGKAGDGKYARQTFQATFRVLKQDELDRLLKTDNSEYELARACLVGWDGIRSDDGKAIAFSADAAADLCAVPYVRRAVTETYLRALAGASEKN